MLRRDSAALIQINLASFACGYSNIYPVGIMAVDLKEMKKHYQDNLKPELYNLFILDEFRVKESESIGPLQAIYATLKSGKFKGRKLLEIGSGPTVHNVASASAYFEEIILSDFVDSNCEELKKWLKDESQLDWSVPLKTVAEIEGYRDLEAGAQEIASRIRKCVKNVVHCDVLSNAVVPLEVGGDFDLIITCSALKSASPNVESFIQALKRLHGLLRPGGGLLMVGYLYGEDWKVGDHTFHYLKLSRHEIDEALELAKFGEREWIFIPMKSKYFACGNEQMYLASSIAR